MNADDLDTMVSAYAECALWSSINPLFDSADDECELSECLDGDYDVDDIDADSMAEFESDCRDFYQANADDLAAMDAGQAGHDFWLTRNGHGAGFWDRGGLGELGERLNDAAKVYGGVDLYPLADGSVTAS
jgi:hypothetical protein